MSEKERFLCICIEEMRKRGMGDQYQKRFKQEFRDLVVSGDLPYLLDLYDRGVKFTENENNLLIVELLGLAPGFDISRSPITYMGEFPDIDVDYVSAIRDYFKNEWAPKYFGQEYVCNIGSYNTFGLKSALIDMAKVHDLSREEIVALTKSVKPKDNEGNIMTWDKAMEMYTPLKKYCDAHPEVAETALKLMDRIRSKGKHAGGLIISSEQIADFVPLMIDNDGNVTSSWTEGLNAQDLGPMGLIKFDLLVITNNEQIAHIAELVRKRYGVKKISALPGQKEWSDTKYLNDPKAIEIANAAKLKGVFQFDSPGIRALVKNGGVKSFDDLVAYTALFRPGPLDSGLHTKYCNRAKGVEEYEIHPLLESILENTYQVIVYQEQIMKIANVVGKIPLRDCYSLIKAISKKKIEIFYKYKEKFIANGQKTLGWDEESIRDFWSQIEKFAGYSFNASHAVAYTYVSARLLYLKAHYPLEYFAGILSCETNEEKIKEYAVDAATFGVEVCPVDINKSEDKAAIVDEDDAHKVYCGITSIKGIGDSPASRIMNIRNESGNFKSFEDFLARFGTDANTVKPLIALRIFQDADSETLYRFYEYYKVMTKKRQDRARRYEKVQEKLSQDIDAMSTGIMGEDEQKEFEKLVKRRDKSQEGFKNKEEESDRNPPSLEAFTPDDMYIEEKWREWFAEPEKAEWEYYGFRWHSPLLSSPDYKGGMTFEDFRGYMEMNRGAAPIELEVESIKQVTSQKGTKYFKMIALDGNDEKGYFNIWMNDYQQWKEELTPGNLVRMSVQSPFGGYTTYSMKSIEKPKFGRRVNPPKNEDARLVVLRKPPKIEIKRPMTDSEALDSICEEMMEP